MAAYRRRRVGQSKSFVVARHRPGEARAGREGEDFVPGGGTEAVHAMAVIDAGHEQHSDRKDLGRLSGAPEEGPASAIIFIINIVFIINTMDNILNEFKKDWFVPGKS